MWVTCPRVLDEDITKWGFAFDDFLVLGGLAPALMLGLVLLPLSPLKGSLLALGLTVMAAVAIYLGKKGKPPGAIFHWLHAMEFVRLPGVDRPTEQRFGAW